MFYDKIIVLKLSTYVDPEGRSHFDVGTILPKPDTFFCYIIAANPETLVESWNY